MILGVDPGGRRVGIAIADPAMGWARPLEVIDSQAVDPIARIAALVHENGADRIVVGRPLSLSGMEGPAIEAQRSFVDRLAAAVKVPVEEHDERLTTVIAERELRRAGAPATRRKELRDAVAAQVMLQGYLDSRRDMPWH
jgi:putative holliday junction resolvase